MRAMQTWQYMMVYAKGAEAVYANNRDLRQPPGQAEARGPMLPEFLVELGNQGWELCGVESLDYKMYAEMYTTRLFFKRPRPTT